MPPSTHSAAQRQLLEHGDPAADARALRRCLGQYPTGVTVITAQNGEQRVGMAVNSFAAVSLDPPLVLWSIRRESRSAKDFIDAGHFAVNILAQDQMEVSRSFGVGDPERFERTAWTAGLHGAALIDGAIAHLECQTTTVHEGGDHLILIGRVLRYARFEGEPLLFSQGQYAVAQSHPSLASTSAPALAKAPQTEGEGDPSSFLRVLSTVHQRMYSQFDTHRQALGVTPASTRILNRLYASPCSNEELQHVTYLGQQALDDELAELVVQGDIQRQADGQWESTAAGRQKSEAVAERARWFTEQKLQGIDPSDVAAARRVLETLLTR